jgi:hypothetical protein
VDTYGFGAINELVTKQEGVQVKLLAPDTFIPDIIGGHQNHSASGDGKKNCNCLS